MYDRTGAEGRLLGIRPLPAIRCILMHVPNRVSGPRIRSRERRADSPATAIRPVSRSCIARKSVSKRGCARSSNLGVKKQRADISDDSHKHTTTSTNGMTVELNIHESLCRATSEIMDSRTRYLATAHLHQIEPAELKCDWMINCTTDQEFPILRRSLVRLLR
jgi:hypothetical protein